MNCIYILFVFSYSRWTVWTKNNTETLSTFLLRKISMAVSLEATWIRSEYMNKYMNTYCSKYVNIWICNPMWYGPRPFYFHLVKRRVAYSSVCLPFIYDQLECYNCVSLPHRVTENGMGLYDKNGLSVLGFDTNTSALKDQWSLTLRGLCITTLTLHGLCVTTLTLHGLCVNHSNTTWAMKKYTKCMTFTSLYSTVLSWGQWHPFSIATEVG